MAHDEIKHKILWHADKIICAVYFPSLFIKLKAMILTLKTGQGNWNR